MVSKEPFAGMTGPHKPKTPSGKNRDDRARLRAAGLRLFLGIARRDPAVGCSGPDWTKIDCNAINDYAMHKIIDRSLERRRGQCHHPQSG